MISRFTKQLPVLFENEKSQGIFLIICTMISLLLANSMFAADYIKIWHFQVGSHSIVHWINDGLMTIFFLLIGLELKREIYAGALSTFKTALLPIVAALGGMLIPAGVHLIFNYDTATAAGAGIPMATDIAFAIGVLSLLGKRVPVSLKIFLTALAVIDDLGAIAVIAIGYTEDLSLKFFLSSIAIFFLLVLFNKLKINKLLPYLTVGILMWFLMLNSGVHATITGVMLAFTIPFGNGDEKSPSYKLQHFLHKPVAFIILPIFALANTCLIINSNWHEELLQPNSIGIISGLVAGKPIGITLFTFLAVSIGICSLPQELNYSHIIGAGLLGGIGFTMSIFISYLAFDQSVLIDESKMAVLMASIISGLSGFYWLYKFSVKQDINIKS